MSSESPPYDSLGRFCEFLSFGESRPSFISAIFKSIWLAAIVLRAEMFWLLAFYTACILAAWESTELFRYKSFDFPLYLLLGNLSVNENKFLLIRIVRSNDY